MAAVWKKPILYRKILDILSQDLHADVATLECLAAHVCHECVERPLAEVLHEFFHHGLTVPQLLSVLLKCESVRMERMFAGYSSQPVEAQYKDLQAVIHHFNDIQEAVLEVGKAYLLRAEEGLHEQEEGLDSERMALDTVDEDAREAILERSLHVWQRHRHMKVYNFFQGVPVYATVDVLHVDGHSVDVRPNADLMKVFACHDEGNMAYGICVDEKDQVRVSLGEVSHGKVQLLMGEVAQSLLNCRKNLGVRIMDQEIQAEMKVRGRHIKKVQLRDISLAGLGLSVLHTDKEPCRTGEVIECRFSLSGKPIVAHGWVRWVLLTHGEVRLGMELRPHVAVQQALQKEVFQIQRKIIVQLNDLGVPEPLKAAL